RAALARNALIRPLGNTIYLMPPYILDDAEIAHLAKTAISALEDALKQ
ncbi:MAG: adenosylmethionine--8-amino-7-oxononanoate transaminase, partial [Proteobacteria bacterium]|nr:adenosylmethionine--8-amino-7-oxononanoate transaminase [Pseudomonadota bacterium]